jgi:hypothetical protein
VPGVDEILRTNSVSSRRRDGGDLASPARHVTNEPGSVFAQDTTHESSEGLVRFGRSFGQTTRSVDTVEERLRALTVPPGVIDANKPCSFKVANHDRADRVSK